MQVELLQNIGAVSLDGVQTEIQNGSHIFIRVALREKLDPGHSYSVYQKP